MYRNGQVYSYEYDGRGSVSELVNSIGETQIKYSYGAYGETVSTVIGWNNPVTNPYRYNAERIDDVAGVPAFQYLRARYLNPYTSTFLTQDSYLGSLTSPLSQNRYTYAQNNPLAYVDPSGHSVIDWLKVTYYRLKYKSLVKDMSSDIEQMVNIKVLIDNPAWRNSVNVADTEDDLIDQYKILEQDKREKCGEALKVMAKIYDRGGRNFTSLPDPLFFSLDSQVIRTTTKLVPQDTSAYCWVASDMMMAGAKIDNLLDDTWKIRNHLTQREVAEAALGETIDKNGVLLNEDGTQKYSINDKGEKILKYAYGSIDQTISAANDMSNKSQSKYRFASGGKLAEVKIQFFLLSNCPILVEYSRKDEAYLDDFGRIPSHAVIITGYNLNTHKYTIYDPWEPLEGTEYERTYDELIKYNKMNSDGTNTIYEWANSITYDIKALEAYEIFNGEN